MKRFTLLLSAMLFACATDLWAAGENTSLDTLFHESFGNNTGSIRDWKDEYSVKAGVAAVYQNAAYSITNAKQGKNNTGQTASGLNQSTQNKDAVFIVGPLSVADYQKLGVTYYWKAASTKGTYTTNLYYSTDNKEYTEVTKTSGEGATTFVQCVYSLPEAAQSSTLYLKVVFNTSNTQAIIDEFVLNGESASTATLQSIEIAGEPTKTNYYAGQTFNPEGLVVTATFDDKSTADVTRLVDWTFDPAVLEEGTTSVSVSATYKEQNAAPMVVTVTVGPAPATKTLTIDLSKDETTTATKDKLEWKGTVLTVTATKGTSTNANNYYPGTEGQSYTSTRFYKGATLSFTPADGITLISITYSATIADFTSAMANSTWTNASTSTSGQTVTITPTDGTKAISAALGGTTGGTSFVINYIGENTPTVVTNASFESQSVKTIENGQLIILRDGVKYNAMGVRLQ